MQNLLSKNQTQFFWYTAMILIGCAPLFFFIMKHYYIEDLDELITYRRNEFLQEKLPQFTISEIDTWNKYNEDIQILPYNNSYVADKAAEVFLYNKAEGHSIGYRMIVKKIEVENQPYTLMSRIPMIETKDLVWNLCIQYGLIFMILLLSLTIVQRILSKKLWLVFYSSLRKIENYSLEQETIPQFDQTDVKEFARLNEILSTLIRNNLMIYKQQKEFIENASHELQTPLAVFQSKLDILLQDSNLTQTQSEAIQLLYDTASRLTRLNKNLLLLAKMDNFQFKEIRTIDFVNTLNAQLGYLSDLAVNNGLHVTVEINDPLVIRANSILLESLINNLVVNSIRHNTNNGSISIVVNGDTFSVGNTGDPIPLNKERIFRRFSRSSEEKKGNGLGLSIVSQICKLHGWDIEYNYRDHLHLFVVRFIQA